MLTGRMRWDVVKLGMGTADGSMKQDEILDWIKEHELNRYEKR